jgi:hypothetical protein
VPSYFDNHEGFKRCIQGGNLTPTSNNCGKRQINIRCKSTTIIFIADLEYEYGVLVEAIIASSAIISDIIATVCDQPIGY